MLQEQNSKSKERLRLEEQRAKYEQKLREQIKKDERRQREREKSLKLLIGELFTKHLPDYMFMRKPRWRESLLRRWDPMLAGQKSRALRQKPEMLRGQYWMTHRSRIGLVLPNRMM